MTNKLWAPGVVVDSPWLNDVNTATYTWLTSIGGTANNITAVGPLAWAAVAGNVFYFLPTATNTAAAGLTINTVSGKLIDKYGSTSIVAGDLVAGVVAQVVYDGNNFQLLNPQASIVPAAQTAINASIAAVPVTGRLLNVQVFRTAGTSTYTPTVGTTRVLVKGQGAGGNGGACNGTTTGQVSTSSGGGAGGIGETFLTSGFSGASIVIGASGASSSFGGTLLVLGSGGVGQVGPAGASSFAVAGTPGTASGGNILNTFGASGGSAVGNTAASPCISGAGGNSLYGAGGSATFSGGAVGPGAAALGNGAGGGGAANSGVGLAAQAGGIGGAGIILVYEYS